VRSPGGQGRHFFASTGTRRLSLAPVADVPQRPGRPRREFGPSTTSYQYQTSKAPAPEATLPEEAGITPVRSLPARCSGRDRCRRRAEFHRDLLGRQHRTGPAGYRITAPPAPARSKSWARWLRPPATRTRRRTWQDLPLRRERPRQDRERERAIRAGGGDPAVRYTVAPWCSKIHALVGVCLHCASEWCILVFRCRTASPARLPTGSAGRVALAETTF